jgi:hypothetical protein
MKHLIVSIALALVAFTAASTAPAFALSSGSACTNSFYTVPSSLGCADVTFLSLKTPAFNINSGKSCKRLVARLG